MATTSQIDQVLTYLQEGKRLTSEQAMRKFGTKNFRATINNLRNYGYDIVSEPFSKKEPNKRAYRLG